jgi:hypothetical protein
MRSQTRQAITQGMRPLHAILSGTFGCLCQTQISAAHDGLRLIFAMTPLVPRVCSRPCIHTLSCHCNVPSNFVRRDRAAAVLHAADSARLGHAPALASSAMLQIERTMSFLAQQSQHKQKKRRQGSLSLVDTSRSPHKATLPRLLRPRTRDSLLEP